MARTYRQSHLRGTSGMAPTPDLLAAMSGFRLIPSGITSGSDLADTPGVRGVLTTPDITVGGDNAAPLTICVNQFYLGPGWES